MKERRRGSAVGREEKERGLAAKLRRSQAQAGSEGSSSLPSGRRHPGRRGRRWSMAKGNRGARAMGSPGRSDWLLCGSREEFNQLAVGSQRNGADEATAESSRYARLQRIRQRLPAKEQEVQSTHSRKGDEQQQATHIRCSTIFLASKFALRFRCNHIYVFARA